MPVMMFLMLVPAGMLSLEALVERHVHHPAEYLRDETTVLSLTVGLRADRAGRAKLHLSVHRLAPALPVARARRADVHVRMPLCEAERHARVELVRRRILARDVHRPDERVASVGPALVQQ